MKKKIIIMAIKQAKRVRIFVTKEYIALAYYFNKKGGEK